MQMIIMVDLDESDVNLKYLWFDTQSQRAGWGSRDQVQEDDLHGLNDAISDGGRMVPFNATLDGQRVEKETIGKDWHALYKQACKDNGRASATIHALRMEVAALKWSMSEILLKHTGRRRLIK